ncbi:hypothetical protein OG21DRAFT_1607627 [Imleria badia]|nr:hypothetical protein OG21DRAFT_1607627 [Imleria badia]
MSAPENVLPFGERGVRGKSPAHSELAGSSGGVQLTHHRPLPVTASPCQWVAADVTVPRSKADLGGSAHDLRLKTATVDIDANDTGAPAYTPTQNLFDDPPRGSEWLPWKVSYPPTTLDAASRRISLLYQNVIFDSQDPDPDHRSCLHKVTHSTAKLGRGFRKFNMLLAALKVHGPDTILVNKGSVCKLTAWRDSIADGIGPGTPGPKRGDMLYFESTLSPSMQFLSDSHTFAHVCLIIGRAHGQLGNGH